MYYAVTANAAVAVVVATVCRAANAVRTSRVYSFVLASLTTDFITAPVLACITVLRSSTAISTQNSGNCDCHPNRKQ
jgi:enolase